SGWGRRGRAQGVDGPLRCPGVRTAGTGAGGYAPANPRALPAGAVPAPGDGPAPTPAVVPRRGGTGSLDRRGHRIHRTPLEHDRSATTAVGPIHRPAPPADGHWSGPDRLGRSVQSTLGPVLRPPEPRTGQSSHRSL